MKLDGKNVLVMGGAGFIGSGLIVKLLEKNVNLTVLDDLSGGKRENIPSDCKFIQGDVRDKNSFSSINDIDFVFHLGSPSSIILFNKNPVLCADITVNGFVNVLEWAKNNGVKKVVYPSSGSVYGNISPVQNEDICPQPVNLYGACKLACETIAKIYNQSIPTVCLRIFAGYGPFEDHKGDFASVVTLFLNSIIKNESPVIFGNGTQSRDFVYIDDVIQAFLATIENDIKDGVINVGSGNSYKFNDVVRIINMLLGKEIKPIYIDKPVNYLENTKADITKMENLLNITPLDLESGIKKYLLTKKLIGE